MRARPRSARRGRRSARRNRVAWRGRAACGRSGRRSFRPTAQAGGRARSLRTGAPRAGTANGSARRRTATPRDSGTMSRLLMPHFRRNTDRSFGGGSAGGRRPALWAAVPRRLRISAVAAVAAVALVPTARAADPLGTAARALESNPVYVAPGAQEHVDAARVRREIDARDPGPLYVAVLPDTGGDPDQALRTLIDDLHRDGTYALIEGNHFRAASNTVKGGAGDLATEAIDAHGSEGATATLVDFVDRVADRRAHPDTRPSGSGWIFPALLLGGLVLFLVTRSRRRRRQNTADLQEVQQVAREDLIALADDVQRLEPRVQGNPVAQAAYDRAVQSYGNASQAFDRARTPKELSGVARALEEGRYEMAVAQAALDGRPAPEQRDPCFFDPRHGPSVRDVLWTPPGGAARKVPACALDAQRVEQGLEPETREIAYGGRMVPYYYAPPMFGGYFGGFLPGLLVGELLGSPFGWGGGGGGDFGGGFDIGGGDFGGGGGDFGG